MSSTVFRYGRSQNFLRVWWIGSLRDCVTIVAHFTDAHSYDLRTEISEVALTGDFHLVHF